MGTRDAVYRRPRGLDCGTAVCRSGPEPTKVRSFAARDWAGMGEILADDIFADDRRRVVNAGIRHGRDAGIKDLLSAANIPEQVPGTATCVEGDAGTLCAFFAYHAGSFVSGRDWVSLTPIFTEAIRVVDGNDADIYYQCFYFDVTTNPPTFKSNVTFGLPGQAGVPHSWTPAHARKVNGKWLLSDTQVGGLTANCARIASTGSASKASQSAPGSHPALRPWR